MAKTITTIMPSITPLKTRSVLDILLPGGKSKTGFAIGSIFLLFSIFVFSFSFCTHDFCRFQLFFYFFIFRQFAYMRQSQMHYGVRSNAIQYDTFIFITAFLFHKSAQKETAQRPLAIHTAYVLNFLFTNRSFICNDCKRALR